MSHNLNNKTEDISTIILHYTVGDFDLVLNNFNYNKEYNGTLAHYLLNTDGTLYKFASEENIAKHAGVSIWDGIRDLNQHSIGIENVNFGYSEIDLGNGKNIDGSQYFWYTFPDEQINSLESLLHSLIDKYHIKPYNVLGHSDIAIPAGRKKDPGILFPWKKLSDNGIGLWYNTNLKCTKNISQENFSDKEKKEFFIQKLIKLGYGDPHYIADQINGPYAIKTTTDQKIIEKNSDELIKNYNMHYRQDKGISYQIDEQDFDIINSLLCLKEVTKYNDLSSEQLVELYHTKESDYLITNHLLDQIPNNVEFQ